MDDLDCGPLIRATQLERVHGFLAEAKRDGRATVAKGTLVAHAPTEAITSSRSSSATSTRLAPCVRGSLRPGAGGDAFHR
jgi:hypothetical protein